MKLEPDVVRDLLLEIEREHQGPDWALDLDPSDYRRFYTAKKLIEAGYLVGNIAEFVCGDAIAVTELTMAGHEFLETVRDPAIWAKTKQTATKVGSFELEILCSVAKEFVASKARELLGVPLP